MTSARSGRASVRVSGRARNSENAVIPGPPAVAEFAESRHLFFRAVWLGVNILLLFSLMATLWSSTWEYSTRRYLKGFSDAIVPLSASPTQKIQAILDWMSHAPTRIGRAPISLTDDRDPTDTLNYASLLRVCGTATNAFINLADSSGLAARRLLLLDENRSTMHVVAEVLADNRWIVVDPTFRTIFRGPDGGTLTREQLAMPATFASATRNIAGYDPAYVFDRTVHVRLARFGRAGSLLRRVLDAALPNWGNSAILSLLLERESLGVTILFTLFMLILLVVRSSLRWYAEQRLGIRPRRIRNRLRRLGLLLLEPAD